MACKLAPWLWQMISWCFTWFITHCRCLIPSVVFVVCLTMMNFNSQQDLCTSSRETSTTNMTLTPNASSPPAPPTSCWSARRRMGGQWNPERGEITEGNTLRITTQDDDSAVCALCAWIHRGLQNIIPNSTMGSDEQYREVANSVTSYDAVIVAVVPRIKVSGFQVVICILFDITVTLWFTGQWFFILFFFWGGAKFNLFFMIKKVYDFFPVAASYFSQSVCISCCWLIYRRQHIAPVITSVSTIR